MNRREKNAMEKYRDVFGNLFYQIVRADGKIFQVTNRKDGNGKYKIIKNNENACMYSDAVLADSTFIWQDIQPFDSFIQAVRYLKQNVKKFL